MFIKRQAKYRFLGYTLVEIMVATGVFGIAALALGSVYLFSTTSFAALVNYAELDKINRTAMDTLSKEVRAAQAVTDATATSLTIINQDGDNVMYSFNSFSGKLLRTSGGISKTLLSDCTLLNFNLYQRNPVSGTYDIYPAATNNYSQTVKCVSLTWKASRKMPAGNNTVSEDIQTARVVIRKQH